MSQPNTMPSRFVRCDPETTSSRLFVPLPKSSDRPPLHLIHDFKAGRARLRFSAREALGIPEQTLFLVLLELAQEQYQSQPAEVAVIGPATSQGFGGYLWRSLHEGFLATTGESIYVRTTWYELAQRCGSLGGRSRRLRREQLQRLSEVVVWEEHDEAQNAFRQSRLVSVAYGDDRRLHLTVNVRLARAIMGEQYVVVSLRERLELATDTAQALHALLSARIRPGGSWKYKVDTLAERLYADSDTVPQGTRRQRRKLVKVALEQLGTLTGWTVRWVGDQVALVNRKSAKVDESSSRRVLPTQVAASHSVHPEQGDRDDFEDFDATRFLGGVIDSPPMWTIAHETGDFR